MIFLKEERLKRVLQEMDKNNLSQMIITETAPIFYLTGVWIHSGERLMALYINTKGDKKFIVNELFPVDNNLGVEVVYYNDTENPLYLLKGIINNNEVLGVDKDFKAHFLIGLMDRKVAKSFVKDFENGIATRKFATELVDGLKYKLRNLPVGCRKPQYNNSIRRQSAIIGDANTGEDLYKTGMFLRGDRSIRYNKKGLPYPEDINFKTYYSMENASLSEMKDAFKAEHPYSRYYLSDLNMPE